MAQSKYNNNEEMLGAGTFGAVYKHWSTSRKVFLARKVFQNAKDFNDEYTWYAKCAQLAMTDGRSSCVVAMLGVLNNELVRPAIDMELAKESLWSVAFHDDGSQSNCLALVDAAAVHNVLVDCLSGLGFLHDVVGISHNDIKPQNLLLFNNGKTKICDLGLCTELRAE